MRTVLPGSATDSYKKAENPKCERIFFLQRSYVFEPYNQFQILLGLLTTAASWKHRLRHCKWDTNNLFMELWQADFSPSAVANPSWPTGNTAWSVSTKRASLGIAWCGSPGGSSCFTRPAPWVSSHYVVLAFRKYQHFLSHPIHWSFIQQAGWWEPFADLKMIHPGPHVRLTRK